MLPLTEITMASSNAFLCHRTSTRRTVGSEPDPEVSRIHRRRALAFAQQERAQALLHNARWPRSVGQAMAAGTHIQMASAHEIVAASGRRSDGDGGMKTWGNLRT